MLRRYFMMNQGIQLDYNTIDCKAVGSVNINPDNWTEFGYLSTIVDGDYTKIVFEHTITGIPAYGFSNITNIMEVYLPNSVTSIGYEAFKGCSSLTSITIPNSVTSIGTEAFYDCSSLKSITIPNSVTEIWRAAFDGTGIYNDESNWENNVLYIDNCLICAKTSISGSYTIKENTRLIAVGAFENCSSLTSITIPNSVTSIGNYAFSECHSLTSVNIPDGVTRIESWAFHGCSSLTSINIPNSVTSIEGTAFAYCQSLTSITIPNSVTSIGESAFYSSGSLTSVTFQGTTEDWNNISKGDYWNRYVPATVVHCTDGDIEI